MQPRPRVTPLNTPGLGSIPQTSPTAQKPRVGWWTLPAALQRPLPSDPLIWSRGDPNASPRPRQRRPRAGWRSEAARTTHTAPNRSREAALTVAAVEVVVAPGTVR